MSLVIDLLSTQGAAPYKAGQVRGAKVRLLVSQQLPFLLVESPEFRAFEKELNPRAEGIGAR